MAVNFEYYKVFFYVAKSQSLSLAAQILHLTQPTVSHYIQSLEADLGVQLFIRSKKGVTMTQEATVMYHNIAQAVEHIAKAEDNLENYKSLDTGSIHITASEVGFLTGIVPVIRSYHREHPGISFKISTEYTPEAIERLKAGLADFIVVTDPVDKLDNSIVLIPLFPIHDIVVCGPEYAFLTKRARSMEELADFLCIHNEIPSVNSQYAKKLEPFFINNSLSVTGSLAIEYYTFQKSLLLQGLGLGVLPDVMVKKELAEGSLLEIPLTSPIPLRNVNLMFRSDLKLPAASKLFITYLKEHFVCGRSAESAD